MKSDNPKIAFLILGYNSAVTLREFISFYDSNSFKFFLHLDIKINKEDYLFNLGNSALSLNLIDDRFNIYWGGFNMIKATLSLIESALSFNPDILVLISDDSMPIYMQEIFIEKLSISPNRFDAYPAPDIVRKRYNNYYYFDASMTSARWIPAEDRFLNNQDEQALIRILNLKKKGKFLLDDLRAGSQWWSMTSSVAKKIISEIRNNDLLRDSFEFSAIPDEMMIQTLAYKFLPDKNNRLNSLMYVDFTKNIKPHVFECLPEYSSIPTDKILIRKVKCEFSGNFVDEIKNRSKLNVF